MTFMTINDEISVHIDDETDLVVSPYQIQSMTSLKPETEEFDEDGAFPPQSLNFNSNMVSPFAKSIRFSEKRGTTTDTTQVSTPKLSGLRIGRNYHRHS